MADATTRALDLIGRLEGREPRSARSLAEELGVTERTVRRDIARLRDLGYPVDTTRGPESGYSLEPGAVLPPIAVTPEEAIVSTLALQHWRESRDESIASSMLDKLRAALPHRARIVSEVVAGATGRSQPTEMHQIAPAPVDPGELGDLARACTRRQRLEIDYLGRDGQTSTRVIEPTGIVTASRRWYLIAYLPETSQWRTLRIDRIRSQRDTGVTAPPREPPDADMDAWFARQLACGWRQVTATVRLHCSADEARRWIAPAWGDVEPESATSCLARVGADTHHAIARWLLLLDADIEVIEPDLLAAAFDRIAERARAAARSPAARGHAPATPGKAPPAHDSEERP